MRIVWLMFRRRPKIRSLGETKDKWIPILRGRSSVVVLLVQLPGSAVLNPQQLETCTTSGYQWSRILHVYFVTCVGRLYKMLSKSLFLKTTKEHEVEAGKLTIKSHQSSLTSFQVLDQSWVGAMISVMNGMYVLCASHVHCP